MKTLCFWCALLSASFTYAQQPCANTYSNLKITSCHEYTSPSGHQNYNQSQNFTDVIPNVAGCDSIISVSLIINKPISVSCTYAIDASNNCYNVTFIINGGQQSTSENVYQVSGDYEGLVKANQPTVSACIENGKIFKATIEDENGCTLSFSDGGALPVELISLTTKITEEGNLIKWITASEIDNDYFTIERSFDGINFKKIHKQDGQGTTSIAQTYTFTDKDITFTGLCYYKLLQTDFDGTTVTMGVIDAQRYQFKFEIEHLTPNPVKQELQVTFDAVFDITYKSQIYNGKINILNSLGAQMLNKDVNLRFGQNTIALDLSGFPAGLYSINIQSNGQQIKGQFVKQ